MLHYWSLDHLEFHRTWLTIGSFDGVHIGHQAIIRRIVNKAHSTGSQAAALTFYPHPGAVLSKRDGPFYLSSPEDKADQLAKLGLDLLVTIPFNLRTASLSASEFIKRLKQHLGFQSLCVGQDFALGHNREGNITRLRELGREYDYRVDVLPPVLLDGQVVSSSRVREVLAAGEAGEVWRLLDRPYQLQGEVVRGDNRGRQLGFPTANLDVWTQRALPRPGVYAGWVNLDGRVMSAVTNVGFRPTFENQSPTPHVETYILDFDEDIYHRQISISFEFHIRDEIKFGSVSALVEQMHLDVQIACSLLGITNHGAISGSASRYS